MKKTNKLVALLTAAVVTVSSVPAVFADGDEVDASAYKLVNAVAATGTSGEIMISWINPKIDNITGMDIVDSNGASVLGETTLKTESGAVNGFKLTGLEDGTDYEYTIKYKVGDTDMSETVGCAPASLYDTGIGGFWHTQNGFNDWSWKLISSIDKKIYSYVDFSEKHSGNSSMKFISNYTTSTEAARLCAADPVTLDPEKTYTLSYWKKLENLNAADVAYRGDRDQIQFIDNNDWGSVPDISGTNGIWGSGDGWQQVVCSISGKSSVTPGLIFCRQGTLWLDDIQLYANDDPEKTNLIVNGGFEYNVSYDITREFAVVGQKEAVISWQNPSGGTITGVDILDENGNKVETATEASTVAGAFTSVKLTGLTNDAAYNYTISVKLRNTPAITKKVTFTPGINFGWDTQNRVKLTDMTKAWIEPITLRAFKVDLTGEAHSGKYGLHVQSNNAGWDKINFGNVALDSSKSYKVSVWSKGKNMSKNAAVGLCNDNDVKAWLGGGKTTNWDEWHKCEYTVSGEKTVIVKVQSCQATFTDLWLDDFAVYELDSDGNEIGENLLANGGFENAYAVTVTGDVNTGYVGASFTAQNYMIGKTLSPKIFLAAYDGKKLVDVQEGSVTAQTSQKVTNSALVVANGNGYTVKAFVWEDNLSPLNVTTVLAGE